MLFPTTYKELSYMEIKELDIILITGEAYMDHPSSGISLIAHLLRSHGYRVGIIDEPDWKSPEDFKRLGRPRLFFGVTSGSLDSMLANYTPAKKKRHDDRSSSGDYRRPDRAVIVYCNRLREIYKDIPIVIGGVEASLRRLAHYDYWSDKVRRSLILDSRAHILVYGMGERQILEIARRLDKGENLEGIRGTVIRVKQDTLLPSSFVKLPSFSEISSSGDAFCRSFKIQERENDPFRGNALLEEYDSASVLQYPPAIPLSGGEMDYLYDLPFTRTARPGLKALEPVLFSIITHRGCFGGCSFCSLGFHQGKIIQSRSVDSILKEAEGFTKNPDFKGYIYDLGGPTANMFGMNCKKSGGKDTLKVASIVDGSPLFFHYNRNFKCTETCLPGFCPNLSCNFSPLLELLKKIRNIKGIKKAFVKSGVRFDLALKDERYLYDLIKYHTGGQLKVAPEHVSPSVLKIMNKPSVDVYEEFSRKYSEINRRLGKKQYLIPYFIVAHPGTGEIEAKELRDYIKKNRIAIEQIQIFTPLPMTRSACMYYTGKDPVTGASVYVPLDIKEKEMQKEMLFYGGRKKSRGKGKYKR